MDFINIGIVAHVDAGKTSLTENLLHLSGRIKNTGSVDKGTAITDSLPLEQRRGISIKADSVSIEWQDKVINIIDTPGHIDFSGEVERSFKALDCAILVVSAVEGVQAHTENLWNALESLQIPTIIFINKIDRVGADSVAVVAEIKKTLTKSCVPLQKVANEATEAPVLDNSILNNLNDSNIVDIDGSFIEQIAECSEVLLEKYLEEEDISAELLVNEFKTLIANCDLTPIVFGSAKFKLGIEEVISTICNYFPIAQNDSDEVRGVVYKIVNDKALGRLAGVRLFSGNIQIRDSLFNSSTGSENKVSLLKKKYAGKFENITIFEAGDIAYIAGMSDLKPGDIIGDKVYQIDSKNLFFEPLLTIKVQPQEDKYYSNLVEIMHELSDEDPTLNLLWLKDERELHIKVMGLIQLEILEETIALRYNLKVKFGDPIVIYKETPVKLGHGKERYTMPKPCWAVVDFEMEPLERGRGVVYESKVSVNKIAAKYQNEISNTINSALAQGKYGWEITDLKISLVDGEDHVLHSRPGDFILATKMAIMNGILECGSQLLEPMLKIKIIAPEQFLGKVISGLMLLRAELDVPVVENDTFILEGIVPVNTTLDYNITLNSMTSGKAKLLTKFHSYQECRLELGKEIEYRGVSPKDRSKYILKHRGALA